MRRRHFLATGLTGLSALAGCSSTGTTDEQDTETATNSPSPTATPTPTVTPTATPTTEVFEKGESVIVGNGEKTLEYIVYSVRVTGEIGGEFLSEEANGVFVVLVMKMANRSDQTVYASDSHLKLVDEQERTYDVDLGTSSAIRSDERFGVNPFSFEQINPGFETRGAVVFDVNPGLEYFLMIEPLGLFSTAEAKLVYLGAVEWPPSPTPTGTET